MNVDICGQCFHDTLRGQRWQVKNLEGGLSSQLLHQSFEYIGYSGRNNISIYLSPLVPCLAILIYVSLL